jgi:succinate dehydrogenase / fumarate reductase flavoprotein subunit
VQNDQVQEAERWALSFMDAPQGDENPYKVQQDLQEMMQDLVGIVRKEDEMQRALAGLEQLWERARKARAIGNREYNPGWHTAMDLHNLLTVSEAVTRAALLRKESRGGQFRDDYPQKDTANFGKVNSVVWKGDDGRMQIRLDRIPEMPVELKDVIREQNDGKLPEELA